MALLCALSEAYAAEFLPCSSIQPLHGLRVHLSPDTAKQRELVLDTQGFRASSVSTTAPNRNSRGMNVGPGWADAFPAIDRNAIPGYVRGFPSTYSPNRVWFASALFPGRQVSGSPHDIAITDLSNDRSVILTSILAVETLAWNPASTLLAVVESRDDHSIRGVEGVVSRFVHGPVAYRDYWLTAYNLEGRPLCRSVIVEGVVETPIRIGWGSA